MSFRPALPPYPPTPGCHTSPFPPALAYKIHKAFADQPRGADNSHEMLPTMILPSVPHSLLLLPSIGFIPSTIYEAHTKANYHPGAEDDRGAGDSHSPYPDASYGSPSPSLHTSAPSSPVCASSVPASPSLLSPPSRAPKNYENYEDDEDLSAHEILRRMYLLKMRHAASLALLNTGGEEGGPAHRSRSSSPTKRPRGSEGDDSEDSQTGRKKRARKEDSGVGEAKKWRDATAETENGEQSVDKDDDADGLFGYIIDDEEDEEEMSDSDYDEDGLRHQQSSSTRTTRKQVSSSAPSSPEHPAHPWPSRRRKNRKKGTKRHTPRVMTGRTCMHCHATSTPEWRTGPQGKGTLCNACGLRWKKTGQR